MTPAASGRAQAIAALKTQHPGHLTSIELARASGASYRQVDFWARCGYLKPAVLTREGSGGVRLYSADQTAKARAMRVLSALSFFMVSAAATSFPVVVEHEGVRVTIEVTA